MSATETLSEWYLRESSGDVEGFRDRLRDGQRVGQAFFNSLSTDDQDKLRGTARDPFFRGVAATHAAISWLVDGAA